MTPEDRVAAHEQWVRDQELVRQQHAAEIAEIRAVLRGTRERVDRGRGPLQGHLTLLKWMVGALLALGLLQVWLNLTVLSRLPR
jgi:hypothetical protein